MTISGTAHLINFLQPMITILFLYFLMCCGWIPYFVTYTGLKQQGIMSCGGRPCFPTINADMPQQQHHKLSAGNLNVNLAYGVWWLSSADKSVCNSWLLHNDQCHLVVLLELKIFMCLMWKQAFINSITHTHTHTHTHTQYSLTHKVYYIRHRSFHHKNCKNK